MPTAKPEPQEYHKCDRTAYCKTMMDRSESIRNARRGFIRSSTLDFSKGGPAVVPIGIMYKVDAKDKGLMLNVCPFCRNPIDFFRQDRVSAETKEPTNV